MNNPATAPEKSKKKKRKSTEGRCMPDEKIDKAMSTPRKRNYGRSQIDIWSAQCNECFKWRIISKKEDYEEIRKKLIDDPFTCNNLPNISCDNDPDIEMNNDRVWVIDKPNLPKTPKGFKRDVILRSDYSKCDCKYTTPNGKQLRANPGVALFLEEYPEYSYLKGEDFSFTVPKIMPETIPEGALNKKGQSPTIR